MYKTGRVTVHVILPVSLRHLSVGSHVVSHSLVQHVQHVQSLFSFKSSATTHSTHVSQEYY